MMIPLPSFHLEVPRSCSIRLIDGSKGRGLFAEQDFEAGDVIFYEQPIAAMQSVENRHEAWTCAHCFDFLQSLEGQMEFHEKRVAASDIEGYTFFFWRPYIPQLLIHSGCSGHVKRRLRMKQMLMQVCPMVSLLPMWSRAKPLVVNSTAVKIAGYDHTRERIPLFVVR